VTTAATPFFHRGGLRALGALKKPANAMPDLNHVLNGRPGYPDALAVRGIAWADA
jgi:hypothetical protein